MKKLKKLNLNNASLMNDAEMKMVTGGYGGASGCGSAKSACENKNIGDSCKSGSDCTPGACRYISFSGVICWRN